MTATFTVSITFSTTDVHVSQHETLPVETVKLGVACRAVRVGSVAGTGGMLARWSTVR